MVFGITYVNSCIDLRLKKMRFIKGIVWIFLLTMGPFFLYGQGISEEWRTKMIFRADSLELKGKRPVPPGSALSYHTAGYAKIMCSAIFITGLSAEFAAENVGYFTAPFLERAKVGTPQIDYQNKSVSIALPNGQVRTAIYTGDQGCVCLAEGENRLHFKPTKVQKKLPNADSLEWPMGDAVMTHDIPQNIDLKKVQQAVDAAFSPLEAMTAAFVVTYKGKIIAEKYGEGISKNTPLESWSMGKGISATLMGILINKGIYSLDQAAPIPQWQNKNDVRRKITIKDLMHMSSGLYCPAPQDPDTFPNQPYFIHKYLYTGCVNSFHYAAHLPQQYPPNTVGRYRNSDPVLVNYLIRLGVEKMGDNYHGFAQKELFDKIGIQTMVMETDPYGNFLTQGYEYASARDWARLGNLYLQNGIWNEERILPLGFTDFVKTPAEAWKADGRPIFGGMFWINGEGPGSLGYPIAKDAFLMQGAGGQSVAIIPSHEMVIVRLGHYKGKEAGYAQNSLNKAYSLLMEAVQK